MISGFWPGGFALIVLLAVAAFAYGRGWGRAPAWTNIPLIALAILSVGPSVCAAILYLASQAGLIHPGAPGYRFTSLVYVLPLDFALLNWAFVPLYAVGRLWPHWGSARVAMWFAVVAMAIPNAMLFALAPTMISGAFDAGQGIGIVESLFLMSPIQMIPGIGELMLKASFETFFILGALTGFLPLVGLVAWLLGQLAGRQVGAS